jgi:predicted transcriptional regulator
LQKKLKKTVTKQLSPKRKQILFKCENKVKLMEEISDELGISSKHGKSQMSKALKYSPF